MPRSRTLLRLFAVVSALALVDAASQLARALGGTMSTTAPRAALLAAAKHGVPYVYQSGPEVVLVLAIGQDHIKGTVSGRFEQKYCGSAGMARAVAARAISDIGAFPEHIGNTLSVSLQYAEAGRRHALRRARRLVIGGGC